MDASQAATRTPCPLLSSGGGGTAVGRTSEKKQDLSAWNSVLQQPFSTCRGQLRDQYRLLCRPWWDAQWRLCCGWHPPHDPHLWHSSSNALAVRCSLLHRETALSGLTETVEQRAGTTPACTWLLQAVRDCWKRRMYFSEMVLRPCCDILRGFRTRGCARTRKQQQQQQHPTVPVSQERPAQLTSCMHGYNLWWQV